MRKSSMDDAPKNGRYSYAKPLGDDPDASRTRSKTKAKRSTSRRSSSENDIPMRKPSTDDGQFRQDKVENKS